MVTGRDRQIVELLDRSGGLDVPSLRWALELGQTVAYRRLGRLEEHGMVRVVRPFRGTPALYIPTRRGIREVLSLDGIEPPSVSMTSYNHQVHVGRVVARLHRGGVVWEASRITRRRQRAALAVGKMLEAKRHSLTLSWLDRSHLPDALIWPSETSVATNQPIAIEVELTQKSQRRLDEILDGYALHLGIRGVVYVCSSQTHEPVLSAVERGSRQGVVNVTTLEEFGPVIDRHPPNGAWPAGHDWMARYLVGDPLSNLERFFRLGSKADGTLTLPGI